MKFAATAALVGTALINGVAAYPQIMEQAMEAREAEAEAEAAAEPEASMLVDRQLNPQPVVPPVFNAAQQRVSITGKHKFVAPGPTDQRGPCPGLNALANHGYMPHNGIGTINDFIESTYNGFGMGRDLGGFLGVYGAIFDGNLQSYSIGFASAQLPVISGMLGTPQGLGGSHNKYENDASPIRGDLYTYGNSYLNQVSLFNDFYQKQAGVPAKKVNYDIPIIERFRKERFENSIANNPYFFNAPFSGAIASTAAFSFIYRFMANKSVEYPEGRLDRYSLMKFYSMTGTAPNFKYTPGHESFPENWYKRAVNDPYNIPFFTVDSAAFFAYYPTFFSIGGNTGKVNTFAGINPGDLTNGVYNFKNLANNPKNIACYFFQLGIQTTPDLLEGVFENVTPAKNALTAAFNKAFQQFNCPKLAKLDYNQEKLKTYPGYGKAYNGYTPPK